jgi:hypothetical protein
MARGSMRRKEHGDYSGRSFRRKYHYSENKNEASGACFNGAFG